MDNKFQQSKFQSDKKDDDGGIKDLVINSWIQGGQGGVRSRARRRARRGARRRARSQEFPELLRAKKDKKTINLIVMIPYTTIF